jgi:hypothetical protein
MYQGLPMDVKEYHVYSYHHIDDGQFLSPKDVFKAIKELEDDQITDKIIEQIKGLFLKAGWEGDGDIELIWIPPFLGSGFGGTAGFYLWHVKQGNNGTSWIASPIKLPLNDEQLDLIY